MLRIEVLNDRTRHLWRIEIVSENESILYSRVAHTLEELAARLRDTAEIVAFAALAEKEQS